MVLRPLFPLRPTASMLLPIALNLSQLMVVEARPVTPHLIDSNMIVEVIRKHFRGVVKAY